MVVKRWMLTSGLGCSLPCWSRHPSADLKVNDHTWSPGITPWGFSPSSPEGLLPSGVSRSAGAGGRSGAGDLGDKAAAFDSISSQALAPETRGIHVPGGCPCWPSVCLIETAPMWSRIVADNRPGHPAQWPQRATAANINKRL